MWCNLPICAECQVQAVHIHSQFVLISHNGHLYTILGGNEIRLLMAARKAIERTRQRGFKKPRINLILCKDERYYFCESCFSGGGEVVSGTAPEWVGQRILGTDVTYTRDEVKEAAVDDIEWGDIPHPDDDCRCPGSCSASVHLVDRKSVV